MNKTKRLFDIEPYADHFEANVLACEAREGGFSLVLDATLFFPEEGGQSADTGTIGGVAVEGVHEEEGVIYHRVARAFAVGERVTGEIDFPARFRKMQNHTGEHIISSLVHKHFG